MCCCLGDNSLRFSLWLHGLGCRFVYLFQNLVWTTHFKLRRRFWTVLMLFKILNNKTSTIEQFCFNPNMLSIYHIICHVSLILCRSNICWTNMFIPVSGNFFFFVNRLSKALTTHFNLTADSSWLSEIGWFWSDSCAYMRRFYSDWTINLILKSSTQTKLLTDLWLKNNRK